MGCIHRLKGDEKTDASDIAWFACEVTSTQDIAPVQIPMDTFRKEAKTHRGLTRPTSQ